jgi:hypothetical protein
VAQSPEEVEAAVPRGYMLPAKEQGLEQVFSVLLQGAPCKSAGPLCNFQILLVRSVNVHPPSTLYLFILKNISSLNSNFV